MVSRKRSRAQLLDHDELSPEGPISTNGTESLKRRKVSATGSSPSMLDNNPKDLLGRVSSLLGFGRISTKEKESLTREAEEDELAEVDVWDVSLSEGERGWKHSRLAKSAKKLGNAKVKKMNATAKKKENGQGSGPNMRALASMNKVFKSKRASMGSRENSDVALNETIKSRGSGQDIWDLRESESHEEAPEIVNKAVDTAVKGRGSSVGLRRSPTSALNTLDSTEEAISAKRVTGRAPRKSDILRRAKVVSRRAKRDELTSAVDEDLVDENQAVEEMNTPHRSRNSDHAYGKLDDEDGAAEPAHTATPTRGKRGRPKKDENGLIKAVKSTRKGILTPGKENGRKGSMKSVAFDMGEMDLGFKDIPSSTRTHIPNSEKNSKLGKQDDEYRADTVQAAIEDEGSVLGAEDADEENDVACAICGDLDSQEPNLMLLCDRCDLAVHQDCCSVIVVPEGDWFCSGCQPDGGNVPLEDEFREAMHSHSDIDDFEHHLRCLQRLLLRKLTGQRRIKLVGYNEEMQKVHQIVEQTVLAGEGNSMLIVGARGCGKTILVESVISNLSVEHREDFHIVRLNGFIHTDDKLAIREIWRQLEREMEVDDDHLAKSNYADTLATLLALLSHPSELSDSAPNQTAKSVILILDEFDLFTTHPRQTLLYNLFDIAQAKKAPIVVLGLTTRVDVIETLEKRVKSRFSHRLVHLSLPRSLPAFWEICKEGLIVHDDELEADAAWRTAGRSDFLSFWHSMIEDLYNKDASFQHCLQAHFYQTKSVPAFFAASTLPVASLSPKNVHLLSTALTSISMSLAPPDSKLHILQGLSELELALLISAARLDIILDTDTCNFAMAYDEYSSLTSKHRIQTSSAGVTALGSSAKVWGRDIALGAWERLADYELLLGASIGGSGARECSASGRMWKVDVGLEEIAGSMEGLSTVMAKWCREI